MIKRRRKKESIGLSIESSVHLLMEICHLNQKKKKDEKINILKYFTDH